RRDGAGRLPRGRPGLVDDRARGDGAEPGGGRDRALDREPRDRPLLTGGPMDYAAFVQAAGRGQPPPIALLHGPDPQLLDDALAAATRGLFRAAGEAALGREVFEGAEASVDDVVRAASTLPFMTGMRLVIVRRGQALPVKGADALAAYARDPNPSSCLLLLGEARKAALAGGSDNAAVGVKEVTAVVGEHRLSGVFDLTRAVQRREVGVALRTLDRLLATEEPMRLLALLTADVRATLTVADLTARGQRAEEIARVVRKPAPVVDAIARGPAAAPAPILARRLERCWEAERRLKSSGEPHAELTALVLDLCR